MTCAFRHCVGGYAGEAKGGEDDVVGGWSSGCFCRDEVGLVLMADVRDRDVVCVARNSGRADVRRLGVIIMQARTGKVSKSAAFTVGGPLATSHSGLMIIFSRGSCMRRSVHNGCKTSSCICMTLYSLLWTDACSQSNPLSGRLHSALNLAMWRMRRR